MGDIRIGISGWTYAPWRGIFFPPGLRQREELAYASRHVRSIEINGTFYALQKPASYANWSAQTPDDFVFSIKAPRFITHIRRLMDVATPLANFFASGVLKLGPKLGPILWQLPPSLPYDRARLAAFFSLLPRDTHAAARLARRHDAALSDIWTKTDRNRPLRHALEVRHASFQQPEFIALLREHDVALVVADTAGKWPFMEDVTSDFIYARLHGDTALYVSGYTAAALKRWAGKIRAWSRGTGAPRGARLISRPADARPAGRDVFVYFDNDVKTHAPYDAMTLAHLLHLGPAPGPMPAKKSAAQPAAVRTRWPGYGRPQNRPANANPAPKKPRAARAAPRQRLVSPPL
jgi:uncharacterized protein YecE (DUF72 family)